MNVRFHALLSQLDEIPHFSYKVSQEVMEQLLEVDQPNISLSVPVNGYYPCIRRTRNDILRDILEAISHLATHEDCLYFAMIPT